MSTPAYTLVAADRAALLSAVRIQPDRPQITRIFQGDGVRVVRLNLAEGQVMKEHYTPASLLVQVLDGRVAFRVAGEELDLPTGAVIHVRPNEVHELQAYVDSHLMLTLSEV